MDGIAAYKETAITTQSRGKLIVAFYAGAIRFLERALAALDEEDHSQKAYYINRAVAIISELDTVLDLEAGGELALNLRRLYLFMIKHLNQATITSDPEMIREVIKLLGELNEGWKAIA